MLTYHALYMTTGDKLPCRVQKEALESFRKECEYLKSLAHKNIVRHFATVIEPKANLPILVMELLDCSLKQFLDGNCAKKLPILHEISLCSDIIKGLAFLHSQNIIHRDLCDENVLIVKGDIPIASISDFGMSRILPHESMSRTLTAQGHRQVYRAPEAMDEPYHYSHTLDVYSFGVLATQIIQLRTNLKNKRVLLAIFKEIPKQHTLKNIIRSCLSENRKKRPQAIDVVKQIG